MACPARRLGWHGIVGQFRIGCSHDKHWEKAGRAEAHVNVTNAPTSQRRTIGRVKGNGKSDRLLASERGIDESWYAITQF